MNKTQKLLSSTLHEVQDAVYGIWINPAKQEELILDIDENGTMTTVFVGTLLGLSTTKVQATAFPNVRLFPDSKNLTQMLAKPTEWVEWYKENIEPFK